MKNKGISLVELLVAMVITGIILTAAVSMFVSSNRVFRANRDAAEMSEDVRNAITTLEFVFSRWGAGVPCPGNPQTGDNNNCQIANEIPPCNNQYPPTDPMCMDIGQNGSSVTFYANLYGTGFVTARKDEDELEDDYPDDEDDSDEDDDDDDDDEDEDEEVEDESTVWFKAIGCRLSTASNQNCYYIWNGGRLKAGYDNDRKPIVVSLRGTLNQTDCIDINNRVNISVDNVIFEPGDYITRVPHRIRIYMQGNDLFMDREDMAVGCNDREIAVRIGRVEEFRVTPAGRSVRVQATFLSADGRRYQIVRFYGR